MSVKYASYMHKIIMLFELKTVHENILNHDFCVFGKERTQPVYICLPYFAIDLWKYFSCKLYLTQRVHVMCSFMASSIILWWGTLTWAWTQGEAGSDLSENRIPLASEHNLILLFTDIFINGYFYKKYENINT